MSLLSRRTQRTHPPGAAGRQCLGFRGRGQPARHRCFPKPVCGEEYRAAVEKNIPGALDQATRDAATFFTGEFPAIGEWSLTREQAERINQPVLSVLGANTGESIGLQVYTEIHERVLDWFPNAKPFVLPKAAHLLQVENPDDMAAGLASFIENS